MATKYIECAECGTDKLTGHYWGCHTGTGEYQIVQGNSIIGFAKFPYGLYVELGKIRQELGNLAGVHVYTSNDGKKLTTKQVTDLLYDYAWNGAK